MSKTILTVVNKIKMKIQPCKSFYYNKLFFAVWDLPKWWRGHYYDRHSKGIDEILSEAITAQLAGSTVDLSSERDIYPLKDNIPRVSINDINKEGFTKEYMIPGKPVIIQYLTNKWPEKDNFTIAKLLERFGDDNFHINRDKENKQLKMPLKQFVEYMIYNRDDFPL